MTIWAGVIYQLGISRAIAESLNDAAGANLSFTMKMLNLGCGLRFHPDWTNVDFVAAAPGVIACDLRKGIPFGDHEFDVVYHSHVLEHFARQEGEALIRQCHRVLRPGGVIRVVVPDLEGIVRGYLAEMERASAGDTEAADRYDWMMLELIDQVARERSGGEMLKHLRQRPVPQSDFILARCGQEARRIMEPGAGPAGTQPQSTSRLGHALRLLRTRHGWGEAFVRLAGWGSLGQALRIGWFRRSGETHRWMYDRYSLARLLSRTGFGDIARQSAGSSLVSNWTRFGLDQESDGSPYKPDSLYMEGRKT